MSRFGTMQLWMRGLVRSSYKSPLMLFLREVWSHPGSAGAPLPSSRQLARRMAGMVPVAQDGLVIELGAGTGNVTQALLDRGVAPERLLVVERSAPLARHLRQRFPRLRIVHGDAGNLGALLPQDAEIAAVVSSVPLRSLPYDESQAIVAHWRDVLPVGTLMIQFTYALYGPFRHLSDGFAVRATRITWINFPPARVAALTLS